MINPRIQQGELAHWLGVIADAGTAPGGLSASVDHAGEPVPAHIAEALQVLRCVEPHQGGLRITEKGRLALRMADPAAIHRA